MVQVTPFLLVLSLALVAPGFSERKCVLTGSWTNKDNHLLGIGRVDQQGRFNGSYISGRPYPMEGINFGTNKNSQTYFKFTVKWSSDTKTIFIGRCFVNSSGIEVLETAWVRMRYVNGQWIIESRGSYDFTRLRSRTEGDIVRDFNADTTTWDADPLSCSTMGPHSQEKFGSAGDFDVDGIAWDTDPFSGSTAWF